MELRKRRQFMVYSAEVYDQTGRGGVRITAPADVDFDEFVRQTRKDQKELNDEYRGGRPARKAPQTRVAAVERAAANVPPPEGAPLQRREAPETLASLDLKLDPGTGNSTVLLGSSKAGKSTLMMHLFARYYAGKEYVSVLFAENDQIPLYGATKAAKKRLVVVGCYEPGLINMAHYIQKQTENHYRFAFMLDDIVDKRDDRTLKKVVLSLRNSDISSIVSLQFTTLLAKNSRANVNNIILFRFNSEEAIELAINQFLKAHFRRLGIRPDDMVDFYKKATADHGFIYLHPSTDSISFHRLPSDLGTPAPVKQASEGGYPNSPPESKEE